jgi:arsenate reductase (thioredoxin)
MMKKKEVLFLCTGNSCRSQMAEGYLRHLAGEKFEVFSAGINPTAVNTLSIEVMKEDGIDISGHRSKSVIGLKGKEFDYIITVCDNARQTCPVFPGIAKRMHWDIEDPARVTGSYEEKYVFFKQIRNKIKQLVSEFINAY